MQKSAANPIFGCENVYREEFDHKSWKIAGRLSAPRTFFEIAETSPQTNISKLRPCPLTRGVESFAQTSPFMSNINMGDEICDLFV